MSATLDTTAAEPRSIEMPSRRRTCAVVLVVVAAMLVVCTLSLAVGSNPISPVRVWAGLLGNDQRAIDIVQGGRIPRTALGLVIGAALGIGGALMQSLTRNPLADPGLLGVNAGAAAAVVVAISFFGITQPSGYIWFALLGAAAASVAVYLLGAVRGAASPVRLVLAGTAISATLYSFVSGVMLVDPYVYVSFRFWDIGSLTGRSLADVVPMAWFFAIGTALAILLARPLNALALGDEAGAALGAKLGRTRVLSVLAVTLLCGAATATVGPIGFVGLAVPHVARHLVGVDHRAMLPASAGCGAVLLVVADVVGRVITWPLETGVGIVTAIVGAPVLVLLVRRGRVVRL